MKKYPEYKYPPRQGDLPKEELIERARTYQAEMQCDIHFKYTCEACGERCTLEEPNTLYEKGECQCGHIMPITHGGFMLVKKLR